MSRRWIALAVGALALAAVPAGIAAHSAARPARGATGSATGTRASTHPTLGVRTPGVGATARAAASPTTSPGGTSTPHAQATAAPEWFTAHVGSGCVRPGDTQTITVQSRPGYVVAYNTRYSDGGQGTTYGGAGYSPVNSDGSYRSAWTVSPTAPPGTVTVSIGTQLGDEPPITIRAGFTVAARC